MFQDGQLFGHLTRRPQRRLRAAAARGRGHRRPGRRAARARRARGVRRPAARRPCPAASGSGWRWPGRSPCEPRLLLLDEPLSALDAGLRERLAGDLRGILRAAGTTALMVTHDHEEAFTVADRIAVMRDGRVVQQGPIDDVWRTPGRPGHGAVPRLRPRCSTGDAAARAARGGRSAAGRPAVALRRSALVGRSPDGALRGTVTSSRITPEQVRLRGRRRRARELDAVAPLDVHPGPGDVVRLTCGRHPARRRRRR